LRRRPTADCGQWPNRSSLNTPSGTSTRLSMRLMPPRLTASKPDVSPGILLDQDWPHAEHSHLQRSWVAAPPISHLPACSRAWEEARVEPRIMIAARLAAARGPRAKAPGSIRARMQGSVRTPRTVPCIHSRANISSVSWCSYQVPTSIANHKRQSQASSCVPCSTAISVSGPEPNSPAAVQIDLDLPGSLDSGAALPAVRDRYYACL
jgi:hypothetical protein